MPITVENFVPDKYVFGGDETGETWVFIKHSSQRDDMRRGSLLKVQEISWNEGRMAKRVIVNQYELMLLEMWLTFGSGSFELVYPDRKEKLFPEGEAISYERFQEDALKLPKQFRDEWVRQVREINPEWYYPF